MFIPVLLSWLGQGSTRLSNVKLSEVEARQKRGEGRGGEGKGRTTAQGKEVKLPN